MDPRQFFEILKRHIWLIIGTTVVVGLAAAILAALQAPVYEGTAQVFLRPNSPGEQISPQNIPAQDANNPDRFVAAQMAIVDSSDVATLAAKSLQGLTPGAIQSSISVRQNGSSDVLDISSKDTRAVEARDVANAVAKSYIENRRLAAVASLQFAADDLDRRLADLQRQIADLDIRIGDPSALKPGATLTPQGPSNPATAPSEPASLATTAGGQTLGRQLTNRETLIVARYAAAAQYESIFARQQELLVNIDLNKGSAELISLANKPTGPISPKPKRDAVLGAFVGLLLALGIVFVREKPNDKDGSSHDDEQLTSRPVPDKLDAALRAEHSEGVPLVTAFGEAAHRASLRTREVVGGADSRLLDRMIKTVDLSGRLNYFRSYGAKLRSKFVGA